MDLRSNQANKNGVTQKQNFVLLLNCGWTLLAEIAMNGVAKKPKCTPSIA